MRLSYGMRKNAQTKERMLCGKQTNMNDLSAKKLNMKFSSEPTEEEKELADYK